MAATPTATTPSFAASLLGSEDYSDLTLACEGQEFKVHKAIICPQSPVLTAALRGDFEEAKTNVVNINFDIATCKRLIDFLYTGKYEVRSPEAPRTQDEQLNVEGLAIADNDDDASPTHTEDTEALDPYSERQNMLERLLSHVRVNAIGDYYAVTALCGLASSRICQIMQTDWSQEVFISVLEQALESTGDKSFYEMAASLTAEHMAELVAAERFVKLDLPSTFAMGLLQNCSRKLEAMEVEVLQGKAELHTVSRMKDNAVRDGDALSEQLESELEKACSIRTNINQCLNNLLPNSFWAKLSLALLEVQV
ncbi:hypothetical protein F4779DRAFT_620986 [Xylariaceae sp. FL0662B]|nr:hypothetical protein F4779DRAFT_620986 [Xylariaceae sp. FL0662B]